MSETINVPMAAQRDIKTVTTEIRTLHRQAQCMVLGYAIEIGRRLKEAKAKPKRQENWTPWRSKAQIADERRALYDLGWTDGQIAARQGMSRETIKKWRQRNGYPANGWPMKKAEKAT